MIHLSLPPKCCIITAPSAFVCGGRRDQEHLTGVISFSLPTIWVPCIELRYRNEVIWKQVLLFTELPCWCYDFWFSGGYSLNESQASLELWLRISLNLGLDITGT